MMRLLSFCCSAKYPGVKWIRIRNHTTHPEKTHRVISFVTDIEGCANYLERFVAISKILKFESVSPQYCHADTDKLFFPYTSQITFQDDESILVVGGDLWDKGGSDLYVIRQLLSLHRRFPERVFFLMGNRDINKMRIVQEMGGILGNIENTPSFVSTLRRHPGVYWLRGTGLKGDPQFIDTEIQNENSADRLRWILSKTMGAPDAFELRKRELQQERRFDDYKGSMSVTDEDVVESYMKTCHPSGEMGQYLSKAKLALRLGHALFLHGALPIVQSSLTSYEEYECKKLKFDSLPISSRQSMRKEFWEKFFTISMPWIVSSQSMKSGICRVQDWVDALNEFGSNQVQLWSKHIKNIQLQSYHKSSDSEILATWSRDGGYFNENVLRVENNHTGNSSHPFGSLLQYGMGRLKDRNKNPTVVYASWLDDGMPRHFMSPKEYSRHAKGTQNSCYARLVSEFLDEFDIDVIVTGHQPVGDSPFPIQVSKGKFIICCDTSYSADTDWYSQSHSYRNLDGPTTYIADGIKCLYSKNLGRGNSLSGRGDVAVSELLIQQLKGSEQVTSLSCHGVLSDGSLPYSSVNYLLDERIGKGYKCDMITGLAQDSYIGQSDWWVKSIFQDGSMLLSKGSGYSVYNLIIKQDNNTEEST